MSSSGLSAKITSERSLSHIDSMFSILISLIKDNNIQSIKNIVNEYNVNNFKDIHGRNLLFYSVEYDKADISVFLLKIGINPNFLLQLEEKISNLSSMVSKEILNTNLKINETIINFNELLKKEEDIIKTLGIKFNSKIEEKILEVNCSINQIKNMIQEIKLEINQLKDKDEILVCNSDNNVVKKNTKRKYSKLSGNDLLPNLK